MTKMTKIERIINSHSNSSTIFGAISMGAIAAICVVAAGMLLFGTDGNIFFRITGAIAALLFAWFFANDARNEYYDAKNVDKKTPYQYLADMSVEELEDFLKQAATKHDNYWDQIRTTREDCEKAKQLLEEHRDRIIKQLNEEYNKEYSSTAVLIAEGILRYKKRHPEAKN